MSLPEDDVEMGEGSDNKGSDEQADTSESDQLQDDNVEKMIQIKQEKVDTAIARATKDDAEQMDNEDADANGEDDDDGEDSWFIAQEQSTDSDGVKITIGDAGGMAVTQHKL
ncbi:hypothetical protein BC834DRAFT_975057 [Gloeopeniophorella convolvens]|nr:hypothetical protein BC834DRAFT_975057 [Gloeopeniophorella convolvens]